MVEGLSIECHCIFDRAAEQLDGLTLSQVQLYARLTFKSAAASGRGDEP
jgi:hypothetical protein